MADETPKRAARSHDGYAVELWARGTVNEQEKYQCTACAWDTFDLNEMHAHVAWHEAGAPAARTTTS